MRIFIAVISLFFYIMNLNNANATLDLTLPSLEVTYGEWNVFTIELNGQRVCYTVSYPVSMSGNHSDNREPYVMVSFFGSHKKEISVVAGYYYKANSIVNVSIDGKQERFIAENDTIAWPEKIGKDKKIIESMLDGFKLMVFSESNTLTYSVDIYSLSGFKKAYKKMLYLCS